MLFGQGNSTDTAEQITWLLLGSIYSSVPIPLPFLIPLGSLGSTLLSLSLSTSFKTIDFNFILEIP